MVRNAGVAGAQIDVVELFLKTTTGGAAGRFQMTRADAESLEAASSPSRSTSSATSSIDGDHAGGRGIEPRWPRQISPPERAAIFVCGDRGISLIGIFRGLQVIAIHCTDVHLLLDLVALQTRETEKSLVQLAGPQLFGTTFHFADLLFRLEKHQVEPFLAVLRP